MDETSCKDDLNISRTCKNDINKKPSHILFFYFQSRFSYLKDFSSPVHKIDNYNYSVYPVRPNFISSKYNEKIVLR